MSTYDNRPVSCTCGTHLSIGAHRFSLVPGVDEINKLKHGDFHSYKFDCNLLVIKEVCPFKNDSKRAFSYLFSNTIMNSDNVRRGGGHSELHGERNQMYRPENPSSGGPQRLGAAFRVLL